MAFHDTKVFISHASEIKDSVVRELASLLAESVKVWYDEYSIEPGGSIFELVNKGLSNCEFGVVVLSKDFFEKKWTQAELAGLFGREDFGTKIIPVWHEVGYQEVSCFSPILADRKAITTEGGLQPVVEFILRGIRSSGSEDIFVHRGTVEARFSELGQAVKVASDKKALYASEEGAEKVYLSQSELLKSADKMVTELAMKSPQLQLSLSTNEMRCIPNNKANLNVKTPSGLMLVFEVTRPSQMFIGIACVEIDIVELKYNKFGQNDVAQRIVCHTFIPQFDDDLSVVWSEDEKAPLSVSEVIDFGLERLREYLEPRI